MTEQARTSRVLIGLIVSMTVGAVVLMALDKGAVQGGAYQLTVYLDHEPAGKVAVGGLVSNRGEWHRIEVYYSQTSSGNARQLATLSGLSGHDFDAHFVICNGQGGKDGEIERTEQWLHQQPWSDGASSGSTDTIRICVVGDGLRHRPTDCQRARTSDLVDALCTSFKVKKNVVIWPANWRM